LEDLPRKASVRELRGLDHEASMTRCCSSISAAGRAHVLRGREPRADEERKPRVEVSRADENEEGTRNQARENEPTIDDPTTIMFSADVETLICVVSVLL
jgi:hypothetical protein